MINPYKVRIGQENVILLLKIQEVPQTVYVIEKILDFRKKKVNYVKIKNKVKDNIMAKAYGTKNSTDSDMHAVSLDHGNCGGRGGRGGRGGSTLWWKKLEKAKKYFQDNHNSWNGIHTSDSALSSWITDTKQSHRKGNLSEEQIQHLQKIHFPFDGISNATHSKNTKLQSTIALKEEWDKGPLPEAKQTTLFEALKEYNTAYIHGRLSEFSAQKLGIALKPLP